MHSLVPYRTLGLDLSSDSSGDAFGTIYDGKRGQLCRRKGQGGIIPQVQVSIPQATCPFPSNTRTSRTDAEGGSLAH